MAAEVSLQSQLQEDQPKAVQKQEVICRVLHSLLLLLQESETI